MDSAYLKANILPALSEALTAMAVQIPEDQVEFLGRYLLASVERKSRLDRDMKDLADLEAKLAVKLKEDAEKARILEEKESPKLVMEQQYNRFVESIATLRSKTEALDSITNFLESILQIPFAYAAVKEPAGESEVLKYVSAGNRSKHILGKKLTKPSGDEGEDAPERQGISFEAFKLPEVPEEEEAAEEEAPPEGEGEEGGENAPRKEKKGPPAPSPLVVTNTMREKRIKFFGIPKLGAYVACPFIYPSLDHDAAVAFNPAEGENPASFSLVKKDSAFLVAMDSVGQCRQFQKLEIERTMMLGNKVVGLATVAEEAAGQATLAYLQGEEVAAFNAAAAEVAPKMAEEEANALAAAAAAAAPPVPAEGEAPPEAAPVEGAEFIKAKVDAEAVLRVWSNKFSSGALNKGLGSLQAYSLPLPGACLRLLYAIACLVNLPPDCMVDAAGDPSWEVFRNGALPNLALMMSTYQPSQSQELRGKQHSLAAIKAYCEANGVLDGGALPAYLPAVGSAVLPWLQKALAAREAAMVWSQEVNKQSLEQLPSN